MPKTTRAGTALIALAALACTEPFEPTTSRGGTSPNALAAGVQESVTGGGQFFHPDFGTVTLAFTAIRHADGSVSGRWQQNQFDVGFAYKGDVTCFAVDPVNHRAWIGGVITGSNDPDPLALVGRVVPGARSGRGTRSRPEHLPRFRGLGGHHDFRGVLRSPSLGTRERADLAARPRRHRHSLTRRRGRAHSIPSSSQRSPPCGAARSNSTCRPSGDQTG
jgi:hypothetical protein